MPRVRPSFVRAGVLAVVAPLLLAAAAPAAGAGKGRTKAIGISLGARSVAHGGTVSVRVRPAGSRCTLRLHRGTSRGPVVQRRRVPRSGRLVLNRLGSPGRRTAVLRCGRKSARAAFIVRKRGWANASVPSTPLPVRDGTAPAGAPTPPPAAPASWTETTSVSWETVRAAPGPLLEAQGAAVGGRLFVFGGFTSPQTLAVTTASHAYVPATDQWERVADVPQELTHAPVAVDGTAIFLVGGYVGRSPGPATDRVWRYDVTTNSWSAGPSLPAPRGAGAAAIVGRELHFFGGTSRDGTNGDPDQPDHWALALDGGTAWEPRAPMPNPRNHLAGVSLGGKVYAIGGQHGENEKWGNQAQVDAYDPASDTWTRVADMPSPRGHISASAVVVAGRIVVLGGTNQGNAASTAVAAYDPVADAWTSLPGLPEGRKTPVADLIDGHLYVATGSFLLPTLRGRLTP